jgi:glyoxylase-like metal-dependent hydrolase (beta-lactamase superfamily II)
MRYTGRKKKSGVVIPVLLAAVFLAVIILYNPGRMLLAMLSMKPFDTQEVIPGVYAVNNSYVNLYLIKNGEQYIAIDAGTDEEATKAALDGLGIDPNDVVAVFLTHTDGDHVAAVPLFSSASVYMSDSNRAFLEEDAGRDRSVDFLHMRRPFMTVADGETVTAGGIDVRCIYTPGHTPGSVCYIVNGKYLFTGDNLNLKNGKAVLFFDVYNMSNDIQRQSLRRLSGLNGIEAVFTAHTGYTDDFEAAFAEWAH